jgi:maleylacetoacetate isomerase
MPSTILYDYWQSSSSFRVRIALNLCGVPYQRVSVDLRHDEQRFEPHLSRNPQRMVPALLIDGTMLTQSLAIIEYLDETRNGQFLPRDPLGRARVRALAHAIAMEVQPLCNLSVARHAAEASAGAISVQSWMREFMGQGLAAVEGLLRHQETGRFCHGDRIGLADICLVPQVHNARRWDIDLSAMPTIRRIAGEIQRIPAVLAAHPEQVAPTH